MTREKKSLGKNNTLLFIASLTLVTSVIISGSLYFLTQADAAPEMENNVLSAQTQSTQNSDTGNDGLQLRSFTPTPSPTNPPVVTTPKVTPAPVLTGTPCSQTPAGCTVTMPPINPTKAKDCVMEGPPVKPCCPGVGVTAAEGHVGADQSPDGTWCDSKPVIYLYPSQPLKVSVLLNLPGTVTESIPSYPQDGWQNVMAYPNRQLVYQGKKYQELYYESAINRVITPPTRGIVASKSEYKDTLLTFGSKLGLNNNERKEFVSYWLNRLTTINSPYMFFSYFSPMDKQKIDGVQVMPEPDTRIEFIMYFKPLMSKKEVLPPVFLPIPQRKGFTMVEWGGILEN